MNQQAASIAAAVLREPVEAATRCEHMRFETLEEKPKFTGGNYTPYKRHSALPKIFILAVTRSHVHVLEEHHRGTELVGGSVVRSWDRAGFKAALLHDQGNAAHRIPNDQRVLYLTLPPDGFSDPRDQELARSMIATGRTGTSTDFVVARDAATQRVIDALGAEVVQVQGASPAAPPASAPPQPSIAQRLQELETLRATGVISEAEYARKREQIVSEL
jgi:hypothetical protein